MLYKPIIVEDVLSTKAKIKKKKLNFLIKNYINLYFPSSNYVQFIFLFFLALLSCCMVYDKQPITL